MLVSSSAGDNSTGFHDDLIPGTVAERFSVKVKSGDEERRNVKVKVRRSIRFRRWTVRAAKKLVGYLTPILIGIVIMLLVIDSLGVYSSYESARDMATRAAVVAHQVLEQSSNDKSLAERQASAMIERNLATFKGIEFRGSEVEVTIVYKARSMILKYIPWVKNLTTITASGSYPR